MLYCVTLFVGASLLFVVQPMMGKMVLPLLGGTPAVWNTCMVFFQAALLGGYAYAHASTAWLGASRQAILHLAILALPLVVLPLGVDPSLVRGGEANPVLDVLVLLSVSVGLPFLVVSATAPLLQRWFTHTGHPAARDPYFLYAASNLGSMLALLGYPALIEPRLPLRAPGWLSQTELWTLGYLLLVGLTILCAAILWRRRARAGASISVPAASLPDTMERDLLGSAVAAGGAAADDPGAASRLRWVALAFVPSSLLLGVTTYITTDLAAVPLLWVLPLAIYLLTFILAFGRWPAVLHRMIVAATVPAVLGAIFLLVSGFKQRIWLTVLCHLALLLVVALACHGELARGRPPARRLTEFYLLISLGGVLGGAFNALVAPAIFTSLIEYPLVMVAACLLMAGWPFRRSGRWTLVVDAVLALGVAGLAVILYSESVSARIDFAFLTRLAGPFSDAGTDRLDIIKNSVNKALLYGPPLVVVFLFRRRPLGLALSLLAVLAVGGFVDAKNNDQIYQTRSFFGVLRISRDRDDKGYTELRHGTTLHGRQSLDPARRGEPLSYYHRGSPIAQVFTELDRRGPRRVAVVGLGTGTLAAYAQPGDALTFYEIDRLVRDIALDPAYFTYVSDARARGASVRVELGDARIRLEAVKRERPGERYDLIVVDAFSSDAIPVHLLTREALRLYLDLLAPGGLVAIHISNRYLDLEPVVAALAEDAGLGGRLLQHDDSAESEGAARSTWAVLSRAPGALGRLPHGEGWTNLDDEADPRVGTWTDDFHNLLSVFKW